MSALLPLKFVWSGDAMVPASAFLARRADQQYVVGENYMLAEEKQRSTATHNHEFAFVGSAWQSLPLQYADEPWAKTPDHLRKYALIRTRFCHVQMYACKWKAEARRLAAVIGDMDEFAVVTIDGRTVTRLTAKSQSRKAMDAAEFQASKQAVLEFIGDLIGVDPATLAQQGQAA